MTYTLFQIYFLATSTFPEFPNDVTVFSYPVSTFSFIVSFWSFMFISLSVACTLYPLICWNISIGSRGVITRDQYETFRNNINALIQEYREKFSMPLITDSKKYEETYRKRLLGMSRELKSMIDHVSFIVADEFGRWFCWILDRV